MPEKKRLTLLLIPDEAESKTHSIRVSYRTLQGAALLAAVALVFFVAVAGTWWYFAAEAARVVALENEVSRLRQDNAKIVQLGAELTRLERQYGKVREMLGGDIVPVEAPAGLPPEEEPRGRRAAPGGAAGSGLAASWPLTRPGFITRSLDPDVAASGHPGLDVAVAQDTYIRAAAAGLVRAAGEDSVYGLYILLQHPNGYQTMYGHASRLFVESGDSVRQNEVIALSGNTGRSTAPHLHFEVRQNGDPIDPLAVVAGRP
jgi:murein DD-endopeptidase MepM/ murein hydrolase activator NlpD